MEDDCNDEVPDTAVKQEGDSSVPPPTNLFRSHDAAASLPNKVQSFIPSFACNPAATAAVRTTPTTTSTEAAATTTSAEAATAGGSKESAGMHHHQTMSSSVAARVDLPEEVWLTRTRAPSRQPLQLRLLHPRLHASLDRGRVAPCSARRPDRGI